MSCEFKNTLAEIYAAKIGYYETSLKRIDNILNLWNEAKINETELYELIRTQLDEVGI